MYTCAHMYDYDYDYDYVIQLTIQFLHVEKYDHPLLLTTMASINKTGITHIMLGETMTLFPTGTTSQCF